MREDMHVGKLVGQAGLANFFEARVRQHRENRLDVLEAVFGLVL